MTEQLCKQAKVLTKQANGTAALAFVQVSNTVSDGLDTFRARHLSCTVVRTFCIPAWVLTC
ncbi:hypothetical protein [Pseudoalteromonas sp. R3]|uniref:hypothetical protein n=1 Tax=Pseudoalteromonas sp. R3 TaxID=1709477 RepID=UPI000FDE5A98|nr:hypothetical protein [Pseudoalteromonas sp. R3]AZZ97514.1 hypothetical protein ELR70_10500 [Pseudoalteromonas sp. R3]